MHGFSPEALGKSRRLTPEDFLLCEGVAIARTGQQIYDKSELALDPGPDGRIVVSRTAEEVFHPDAMASLEGKPVTVEHPDDFVNPSNWRDLEVGTAHNVRCGEGIEGDLLLADLLIKDGEAIAFVNRYKPEISCGYNSEYGQKEPGRATQKDIIGNHVALLRDRGRAGPRCAIRDHLFRPSTKEFGRAITAADCSKIAILRAAARWDAASTNAVCSVP